MIQPLKRACPVFPMESRKTTPYENIETVLERIFLSTPAKDVLRLRRVCQLWNAVFYKIPVIQKVFNESVLSFDFIKQFFLHSSFPILYPSYKGEGLNVRIRYLLHSGYFEELKLILKNYPSCAGLHICRSCSVSLEKVFSIYKTMSSLKEITFFSKEYFENPVLVEDCSNVESWESLSLNELIYLSKEDFQTITRRTTSLRSLSLSILPVFDETVLAAPITGLTQLHLKDVRKITQGGIQTLLLKNLQLRELTLALMGFPCDQPIDFGITRLTNLTKLELLDLDFGPGKEESLKPIFENLTQLSEIGLSHSFRISGNCFDVKCSKAFTRLKKLVLRNFKNFTFDGFNHFLETQSRILQLETLRLEKLESVQDRDFKPFYSRTSGIKRLSYERCYKITHIALETKLPHLISLKGGLHSGELLVSLFQRATRLKSLNLFIHCDLHNLSELPPLLSLTHLTLRSIKIIGIANLFRKMPNLLTLSEISKEEAIATYDSLEDPLKGKFLQILDIQSKESLALFILECGRVDILQKFFEIGLDTQFRGRSLLLAALKNWEKARMDLAANPDYVGDLKKIELISRYRDCVFLLVQYRADFSPDERGSNSLQGYAKKLGDLTFMRLVFHKK